MARSDINKEPSGNKSSVSPKVAATSSPTIYRSAVPSAMLSLSAALAPLRSAVSRLCPLRLSPLSLPRPRPLPRAAGAHSPHPAWLPPRSPRSQPLCSLRAPQARTPPPAPRHTDEVYFPRSQPLTYIPNQLSTNPQTLSSNPQPTLSINLITHKNLWSLSQ